MSVSVMLLLDLFCGAGMAADGYTSVGLAVGGADIRLQPHYPYPFMKQDALALLDSSVPESYDVIHASPPCQLFTRAKHLRVAQGGQSKESIDLLTPTIELLRSRWGHKMWVVENVEDKGVQAIMAPRQGENLVRICGSAFYLGVQRHRWFLSNAPLRGTLCDHSRFPIDPERGKPRPWGVYHTKGDSIPSGGRTALTAEHGREVMGVYRPIPWDSLKEGFPPAYTSHVGADLLLTQRSFKEREKDGSSDPDHRS